MLKEFRAWHHPSPHPLGKEAALTELVKLLPTQGLESERMSEQAEKGVSSYAGEVGGPAARKSGGSAWAGTRLQCG